MTSKISSSSHGPDTDRFTSIFDALPPLGSTEYLVLLETVSVAELPAQVLARAFRQLALSGAVDAADATLGRLLGSQRFDYLKAVRIEARKMVAKGQYSYDKEDLVQATAMEIAKTLPTTRGALAETAWVAFARQRLTDAWRIINGRRGEKLRLKRVEPTLDEKTGETVDPLDLPDIELPPWHVRHWVSEFPWLEDFVHRVIESIADPTIQFIARDQFGDAPSSISGRSADGKAPLTEQLSLDRFQISRALRSAKARLAAELIGQRERDLDCISGLNALVSQLGNPAQVLPTTLRSSDQPSDPPVGVGQTVDKNTSCGKGLSPRTMSNAQAARDTFRKLS